MGELQAKEKELQKHLNAKKSKLLDLQIRLEELDNINGEAECIVRSQRCMQKCT